MALLARSVPAGWLLGLAELAIGVPYDIVTRQFGFVAVSVVMAWVFVRGWVNFRRNRKRRPAMPIEVRLYLFLVRLWLAPVWAVSPVPSFPGLHLAAVAAAVIVAGMAVLAVHAPAWGCRWAAIRLPGERARLV